MRVDSLGQEAVPCLLSAVTPRCFPQWPHPFAIPPAGHEGFPSSTASPALVGGFIDESHSDRGEGRSPCMSASVCSY